MSILQHTCKQGGRLISTGTNFAILLSFAKINTLEVYMFSHNSTRVLHVSLSWVYFVIHCLYIHVHIYANYVQESKDKQHVELTRQISLLKNQLDRTAETQKDFVELSQSLQVSSRAKRVPYLVLNVAILSVCVYVHDMYKCMYA